VSGFIGLYQGDEHELHFLALAKSWAFIWMSLYRFIGLYQGDEHELHFLALAKSWAFIWMSLYRVLKVWLHVSANIESLYLHNVGRYHEHSMFQHACLHVLRTE
jgi:hypothetical protein